MLKEFSKLSLVDHYLVEIDTEPEKSASGLLVVSEREAVRNYGTVVATPHIVSEKTLKEYDGLIKSVTVGSRVFFPVNVSYNEIKVSNAPSGKKYLLVPPYNVQAVEFT